MKKIEINILPLVISVLLVLISVGIILTSNYLFSTKHYVGIGCLFLSIILYFINRKFYFLFFALILTIGLIGFLDFYITSYKVGFAGVGINPLFLGLMILFFVTSKSEMDKLSPDERKSENKTPNEILIKSFESKFTNKTSTELREIIVENSKFTEEAKTAAKRILDKKRGH